MRNISKYTYQRRKEQGLCVLCGNEKDGKYVACLSCRNKQKQDSKDRRDFLKNIGICYKCGKNKLYGQEKICPECLANNNYKTKYNAEYQKTRYEKLRSQNICTKCQKNISVENKTYCKQCLIKHRNESREYRMKKNGYIQRYERISYGLCYICGDETTNDRKLCDACNGKVTNNLPKTTPDEYRKFIYKGFKFDKPKEGTI